MSSESSRTESNVSQPPAGAPAAGKPSRLVSLPVVSAEDYRSAVPGELWERPPISVSGPISYRSEPRGDSAQAIAQLAANVLAAPLDYPAIEDAIVSGDHVSLAVDPNVPRLSDLLTGIVSMLDQCDVGQISIVLWNEATDALMEDLKSQFADRTGAPLVVARHQPRSRGQVRYVAADEDAEAIYLARDLVDADFTLPIVAARSWDVSDHLDKAGVFPMFADAATMRRYQSREVNSATAVGGSDEVGWLLGVQLMMMVSANAAGGLGRALAGTPDAIRSELETLYASGDYEQDDASETSDSTEHDETLPRGDLIIAALDGDAAGQTWSNLGRALIAASHHASPGGTLVVWSRLSQEAGSHWQRELISSTADLADDANSIASSESSSSTEDDANSGEGEEFEDWQLDLPLARTVAQLREDYRILLHSDLNDDHVEALGLGVIASVDELKKLTANFQGDSDHQEHKGLGVGVLRAAQFHSGSVTCWTRSEAEAEAEDVADALDPADIDADTDPNSWDAP